MYARHGTKKSTVQCLIQLTAHETINIRYIMMLLLPVSAPVYHSKGGQL